jgi:S-adenosylmethionine synthetase
LVDEDKIEAAIRRIVNLSPAGIIERLDLLRPIYEKTAAYGHFGRGDMDFSWEKTDITAELKAQVL